MSNRELITILSGFSLILFISLYYNISKSTVNTTAENIQAVVSMITLIVSIVTIYFVYKAYQSQNEQIAIQKQELEESRKEIEENKKDVEFNRILDIVYRQLEFTHNELKEQEVEWYLKLSSLKTNEGIFPHIRTFKWIFKIMSMHYAFFDALISESELNDKKKLIIDAIIGANFNYKLVHLFWFLKTKLDSDEDIYKEYLAYIQEVRIQMQLMEISKSKSHEQSNAFYRENIKAFDELVKIDMNELLVYVNRFKKAD